MPDKLTKVGWLVWNVLNPLSKEFTKQALTEADMFAGYRSQAVYTKESENA